MAKSDDFRRNFTIEAGKQILYKSIRPLAKLIVQKVPGVRDALSGGAAVALDVASPTIIAYVRSKFGDVIEESTVKSLLVDMGEDFQRELFQELQSAAQNPDAAPASAVKTPAADLIGILKDGDKVYHHRDCTNPPRFVVVPGKVVEGGKKLPDRTVKSEQNREIPLASLELLADVAPGACCEALFVRDKNAAKKTEEAAKASKDEKGALAEGQHRSFAELCAQLSEEEQRRLEAFLKQVSEEELRLIRFADNISEVRALARCEDAGAFKVMMHTLQHDRERDAASRIAGGLFNGLGDLVGRVSGVARRYDKVVVGFGRQMGADARKRTAEREARRKFERIQKLVQEHGLTAAEAVRYTAVVSVHELDEDLVKRAAHVKKLLGHMHAYGINSKEVMKRFRKGWVYLLTEEEVLQYAAEQEAIAAGRGKLGP